LLLDLLFDADDAGCRFLQNFVKLLTDYTSQKIVLPTVRAVTNVKSKNIT
jgi:hypothetical protein